MGKIDSQITVAKLCKRVGVVVGITVEWYIAEEIPSRLQTKILQNSLCNFVSILYQSLPFFFFFYLLHTYIYIYSLYSFHLAFAVSIHNNFSFPFGRIQHLYRFDLRREVGKYRWKKHELNQTYIHMHIRVALWCLPFKWRKVMFAKKFMNKTQVNFLCLKWC